MKTKAYLYVRMSTVAQSLGDSKRRQTELAEKYARKNNLDLDREFNFDDIGVSAFKGKNAETGGLSKFLTAIESGKVDKGSILLIESFDRLSRNELRKAAALFLSLINNDITIVTLIDEKVFSPDTTNFSELILSIAFMSRANEESEVKSKRGVASWEKKRIEADSIKITGMCPKWLTLSADKKFFIPNEERIQVIRYIFELSINGYGDNSIVRKLNNESVPTFGRSTAWQKSSVTKILKNRSLLGEFQPHRMVSGTQVKAGKLILDYFPTIIEEETFEKAQNARRARRVTGAGTKKGASKNIFSGLLFCANCKGKMHFVDKGNGPKGGKYLICDNKRRGIIDCPSKFWKYDDFENLFLSTVVELNLPDLLNEGVNESEISKTNLEIDVLQNKIFVQENERMRVLDIVKQATSSEQFLISEIDQITNNIDALKNKLDILNHHLSQIKMESTDYHIFQEELKSLISDLYKSSPSKANEIRSKIRQRVKELIVGIRVASDGSNNLSPEIYFEKPVGVKQEAEVLRYSQLPYFDVWYKDNASRRVIANAEKVYKYEEQIRRFTDAGGVPKVSRIMVNGQETSRILPRHSHPVYKITDFNIS